jgi:leucyl aminopeptidase (aminopeptidase T)
VADAQLERAAATAVERLGVEPQERLLVVYNEELSAIADAIANAARGRTKTVRSLPFPTLMRSGEEPADDVAAALLKADAALLVTTFSLSHTRARHAATQNGVRIASMPGITLDMFVRTVPVDYTQLTRRARMLAEQLTEADRCRIRAPAGTDVELVLRDRTGRSDDGDLRASGAFGNLPAGEAYIAPVEREGAGTIVFDASVASSGLLKEPLRIEFANGRAISASGGDAADILLATLDAGGPNGRVVAELGIGTNPGATITGKILEDEKAEGTMHIAFGTNSGIGGENEASVHIDGVFHKPTLELDGRVVIRDGRLVL